MDSARWVDVRSGGQHMTGPDAAVAAYAGEAAEFEGNVIRVVFSGCMCCHLSPLHYSLCSWLGAVACQRSLLPPLGRTHGRCQDGALLVISRRCSCY